MLVFAQVLDPTASALRLARLADVAAMQDQPVVGIEQVLARHELQQFLLHLQNVLSRCYAGAVGDAEDMRVHRHGQLPEGGVEHHVGGLAANPGQGFEVLAVVGDLAAVLFDEDAAGFDDVLRLAVVEADGLDVLRQPLDAEGVDRLGVLATG